MEHKVGDGDDVMKLKSKTAATTANKLDRLLFT